MTYAVAVTLGFAVTVVPQDRVRVTSVVDTHLEKPEQFQLSGFTVSAHRSHVPKGVTMCYYTSERTTAVLWKSYSYFGVV